MSRRPVLVAAVRVAATAFGLAIAALTAVGPVVLTFLRRA